MTSLLSWQQKGKRETQLHEDETLPHERQGWKSSPAGHRVTEAGHHYEEILVAGDRGQVL